MLRAFDGHGCQVAPDTPQVPPFAKPGIDRPYVAIAVEDVVRHRLEVVDECEIHFWMPVVDRGIDDDRPRIGADEVVLRSVAVQERGNDWRTTQFIRRPA